MHNYLQAPFQQRPLVRRGPFLPENDCYTAMDRQSDDKHSEMLKALKWRL